MISKEIFTKQAAYEPQFAAPKIPLLEKHLSPDKALAGKAAPFVLMMFLPGFLQIFIRAGIQIFTKLLDIFFKRGAQKGAPAGGKREPYYATYKDKANDIMGRLAPKEAPSGAEAKVNKERYYAGSSYFLNRILKVKREAM
ncbi:MAG: hypothetical protein V1746_05230, partial [bacterium]